MPVGYMLKAMKSNELTEWMAYFRIKNEVQSKPKEKKIDTQKTLQAMFAHRLVKKNQ